MAKSPVVRFSGERSLFSNFYPCDVSRGVEFHSGEAASQFKKKDFATAEYIKRRSKHIFQTRSGWGKVHLAVMRALVRGKFHTRVQKSVIRNR